MIVISPHFDDAVFSVGEHMRNQPGLTIVTVCAGRPDAAVLTSYDESAGFRSSYDAMVARSAENLVACSMLNAMAVNGPFLDNAYRDEPLDIEGVAEWLDASIPFDYEEIWVPLGIHHPDHMQVAEACQIALDRPHARVYAEIPYHTDYPNAVNFDDFKSRRAATRYKLELINCYRSQLSPSMRDRIMNATELVTSW